MRDLPQQNLQMQTGFSATGQLGEKTFGSSRVVDLDHALPHLILMQPNGIRISSDELIHLHSIDGGRSPDSLLLSMDENGHEILLSLFLRCLLGGGKFSFWF